MPAIDLGVSLESLRHISIKTEEYTGKVADAVLGQANITVNKNAVPNDPRSPFVTSGLRIGTPAVTTRGFKEAECIQLTHWICDVLDGLENGNANELIATTKQAVLKTCRDFSLYDK